MKKITVLVNRKMQNKIFTDEHFDILRSVGELNVWDGDDFSDNMKMLEFVENSDVIITSWQTPALGGKVLDRCPNLLGVVHGAGSIKPNIDEEFIRRRPRVSNSAIEISRGVAETTLGIAIAACKGFFRLSDEARRGMWRESFSSVIDFYDLKIGVVGAGNAGRHFIKLLQGFCVDVLVYDPCLSATEIAELGAKKCELAYLMAQSDVISLHAPSIPATKHMINRENLSLMKDRAVLINTARGSLINETDLIAECKRRNITAVLDVTDPEPPAKESELRSLPNVHLLQHIAGVTTNGAKRIGKHVCEETKRLLAGERMKCEMDLSKLDVMA